MRGEPNVTDGANVPDHERTTRSNSSSAVVLLRRRVIETMAPQTLPIGPRPPSPFLLLDTSVIAASALSEDMAGVVGDERERRRNMVDGGRRQGRTVIGAAHAAQPAERGNL